MTLKENQQTDQDAGCGIVVGGVQAACLEMAGGIASVDPKESGHT